MTLKLVVASLCLLAAVAGCSKPAEPQGSSTLPPPMPGAKPFKVEPLAAPDPEKLRKAIEEERLRQEQEAGKASKGAKSSNQPATAGGAPDSKS